LLLDVGVAGVAPILGSGGIFTILTAGVALLGPAQVAQPSERFDEELQPTASASSPAPSHRFPAGLMTPSLWTAAASWRPQEPSASAGRPAYG
jgi:hypothetical protein